MKRAKENHGNPASTVRTGCLYALENDGIPKRCLLNNECFHCAYDQWLDAAAADHKK